MGEKASKTRKYIFISIAGMTVLIFCFIFFVNIPIIKKVLVEKDLLEAKKLKIESERADAAQSGKLFAFVESLEGEKGLLEGATIKKDSVIEFIEEVEGIAYSVGGKIEISHIESQGKKKAAKETEDMSEGAAGSAGATKEKKGDEVVLKIGLQGTYRQFLEFYYKLENMPFIFSIESFEIRKGALSVAGLSRVEEPGEKGLVAGEILISFSLK